MIQSQYQTQLASAEPNWRVGDIISNYKILGFVGISADGEAITETLEMYDDAKCVSGVAYVKAVIREI